MKARQRVSAPPRQETGRFGCRRGWLRPNFVAVCLDETKNRTQRAGNPRNIGFDYAAGWRTSRGLPAQDEKMLVDLWDAARRMEERLDNLERATAPTDRARVRIVSNRKWKGR